jgi:hypothetical protein
MANQVTLRCFPPEAIDAAEPAAEWKLESLAYIFDGGTLDPRDETLLYAGADQVFEMDWSKSRGEEGTYTAFTANLRDFFDEAISRRGRCSPLVRWIAGQKFLVLRGNPGICFYRFDPKRYGRMPVPCAVICSCANYRRTPQWPANAPERTRQPWIWMDGTGGQPRDGLAQPEEYLLFEKTGTPGGTRWDVDAAGDVWHTGWRMDHLVRFSFDGLADGVPTWSDRETIPAPAPFVSMQWSRYDVEEDVMVFAGDTLRHPGSRDIRN